ncbi:MAG TPA: hypothetical protein VHF22_11770, partial [Planctomycetota bacterium]|nr:hypothetical protein [Planctomycetota bacterium]
MDPRPLPDDADADDDGLTRAPEASPAFLRGLSVVFACIFGFGLVYCARDFLRFPAEPVAGALDALAARVDERPCWVALELPRDADVRTVRDGTVDEVVLTPRGGGKVLAIRCSSSFRPADIARGRATGGLERATPYLRGRLRDAGAPVDEAREV